MAIAGRWMRSYYNRPDFEMFRCDVYTLCGDGCMMEGVSGEAASLTGHFKLSYFCRAYDINRNTFEGAADKAQAERAR